MSSKPSSQISPHDHAAKTGGVVGDGDPLENTTDFPNHPPRGPPRVLSIPEAAAAAGVSVCTLRRRILDGSGPRITRMSVRRIGIRENHLNEWLDACAGD
jgi:predicted DNA-binding transcriptional regulator AlpA